MKNEIMKRIVEIPEGVQVTINGKTINCKGPKGEVTREFKHPRYIFLVKENKVILETNTSKTNKRDKTNLGTLSSHVKNLIEGVNNGFLYKLKICSGHFPMNVSLKNNQIIIKNFIGEKVPRVFKLKTGADVKLTGDIIEINSVDKEIAGTIASDIEKLTKRSGFDNRIFQDGIYIIEKAGKKI